MRKIKTFYPLKRPQLDGSREKQWCTYSSTNGFVYLLNGERDAVANLRDIDISKDIHFNTEVECHQAAAAYYTVYGQQYPYMKEWSKLWTSNVQITAAGSTVESEVMRFK